MRLHPLKSSIFFLCTFITILLVHTQCSADSVDQQQREMPVVTEKHCTFDNSDHECAAQTDRKEAYTKPQDQATEGEASKSEDDYQDFLHRSMERLEGMLEESRDQVLEKLRKVMDKMAHSRDRMIKKLDAVLDTVSHSRLVTEIDHLLEEVSHSKIIKDMKSLPRELKESLLLSVRNRSYVAAGIMVIATMAVLVGGSLYFAWCHHDGWSLTYDYKALGASAVAAVTGATHDKDQGQDTGDLADLLKEKSDGGKNVNSQKSSVGEKSRDKDDNCKRNLNKGGEGSESSDIDVSDCINKDDEIENGTSFVNREYSDKKTDAKNSGSQASTG